MAKKVLLVLVLAAIVTGGAYAQLISQISFSAGGGGFIGGDFGGGIEMSQSGEKGSYEYPYFGGGGFIFCDATYAELSLGFFGGSGKAKMSGGGQSAESDFSIASFNIGLLGKYPFAIDDNLTVFPLLGIDYQIVLSFKDEDGDEHKDFDNNEAPGDFSALWFKFGGGADYSLTGNIFLRAQALYGLRIPNKFENDMVDLFKELGSLSASSVDVKTLLGHGLTVKVAVGYRF